MQGMLWTVRLPSGAMLTMLPPGVADGADTEIDCYRQVGDHNSRRRAGVMLQRTVKPSTLRGSPGMGTMVWGARCFKRS